MLGSDALVTLVIVSDIPMTSPVSSTAPSTVVSGVPLMVGHILASIVVPEVCTSVCEISCRLRISITGLIWSHIVAYNGHLTFRNVTSPSVIPEILRVSPVLPVDNSNLSLITVSPYVEEYSSYSVNSQKNLSQEP